MASITRKPNGTYKIVVSLGYDVNHNKLRQSTTYKPDESKLTKTTAAAREKELQKMVERFAAEFEEKCKAGNNFDGERLTLKAFSEKWLEEYAAINMQETTISMYKDELSKRILPALGHKKLSELKPAAVNAFYVSLTKDGCRLDGRTGGYSFASRKRTAAVLSSVLSTAEQWEIIDRNPCNTVKIPSAKKETETAIKYFTPEQTEKFLEFLDNPNKVHREAHERHMKKSGDVIMIAEQDVDREIPLRNIVLLKLALNSGARKGELIALKWSDIDFKNNSISISKTVERLDGGEIVKQPKTEKSNRTVVVSSNMVRLLKQLKAEQQIYKNTVRDFYEDGGWIFVRDNGNRISYDTPYWVLKYAIRRYNATHKDQLPEIPFHGLRHTSATALVSSGMDIKTIADRLGHSTTNITLNIYAHSLKEKDKEAAETLENLFRKQA